MLELENKAVCKVTGVIRDLPQQSHFSFQFIIRPLHDSYNNNDENDWLSNNYISYILAKPGVSRDFLQGRVDAIVDNYLSRQLQDLLHTSTQDMKKAGQLFQISPHALAGYPPAFQ